MTRTHFTRELRRLQDEVLMLGSIVRQAILDAVAALRQRDLETAKRIIAADRQINARRFAIEDACFALIATQQPMAGDLRLLAAVLEISVELERMGDYAKGISRISLYLGPEPLIRPLPQIDAMCDRATDMLRRALDAFVNQDLAAAQVIPAEDDAVDALYNEINRELIGAVIKNPDLIDRANHLTWVAHNLERAADRVTNICERVIYTITGNLVEFDAEEPFLSGVN
jgi:phosphate transport system protein